MRRVATVTPILQNQVNNFVFEDMSKHVSKDERDRFSKSGVIVGQS